MELIPIKETSGENEALLNDPLCRDITNITIEFYKKTGFVQP